MAKLESRTTDEAWEMGFEAGVRAAAEALAAALPIIDGVLESDIWPAAEEARAKVVAALAAVKKAKGE